MASGRQGAVLRKVGRLLEAGTVAGLDEGELLERFAADRDERAFEALLTRHGPMVLGVCRRWLSDPRDVEDAFQATALILIRKARSIKEPGLLGPWLHGVAYRVAHRARKVAARRGERERPGTMIEEVEGPTRPVGDREELRLALDQEIHRLPEVLRLPIVLCHFEGLTQPEAATRLRTTPDGVRGRLARAREKLRARLTRRGFALPAGLMLLELAAESASAAVPAALIEASLPLIHAGAVPTASVAILTKGVIPAMTLGPWKTIGTAMLGLVAVVAAAAGFAGRKADEGATPEASPPRVVAQPRLEAEGPDDQPRSIRVEARDLLTEAPLADVALKLNLGDGLDLEARTDPAGSATFDLPAGKALRYFNIAASRAGLVPLSDRWIYESTNPRPPDHFLFQMEKATTIGGRVLDQARQPVAGATVFLEVSKRYPRSSQSVVPGDGTALTDPDGRWSFANVPANPDSISFAVHHPLHLSDKTSYQMAEFKDPAALRDGSALLEITPRGTLIQGQVLTPDGQPAPGAEVFCGTGRRYGNSIPSLKADASGRFSLGIKPGTITSVTARAPGFGPAGQELRVGADPKRVTLRLEEPKVLGGRVVDRAGRPIAGAGISVAWSPVGPASSGRSSEAIAVDFKTDADGRFAWKEAPGGEAHAELWADGYLGRDDITLSPGVENRIELTAETRVKGIVVDAGTGQPVSPFTLTYATVRNPGERLLSQRISGMDKDATKGNGTFEYTFEQSFHQVLIRVEGDGYLPEETELFAPDGTPREFTFHLTRADPIRGTVANPDGSPARGAIVYLVPADEDVRLQNGEIARSDRDATIQAKVEADGRFSLSPRRDDFLIFALSDAGLAVARRGELHGDDALRLQAWARVSGTVKVDGQPGAGIELSQDPEDAVPPKADDEPLLEQHYFATTDRAGRFEFPRVAPGRHEFGQWVPNGAAGRLWFVGMASVDAQPGRAHELKVGESGRAVTGKLAVPSGGPWMIRTSSVERVGSQDRTSSRGVRVFEDGRFRVEDLTAGDYALKLAIHEPPPGDECGWGRLIAAFRQPFTVAGAAGDGPIDLGKLEPVEVGGKPLLVGEMAPPFTVKALDGREFTLADHRGRFVLIDFWATWCAPCVAEVPNLKAVHDAFAADPRFVLVSLCVDEDPATVRSFLEGEKLPWPQGLLGPDSPVTAAYGATAIPATFLIGPDGKVLARDLRGARIKAAVAEALER